MEKLKNNGEELLKDVENIIQNYIIEDSSLIRTIM